MYESSRTEGEGVSSDQERKLTCLPSRHVLDAHRITESTFEKQI